MNCGDCVHSCCDRSYCGYDSRVSKQSDHWSDYYRDQNDSSHGLSGHCRDQSDHRSCDGYSDHCNGDYSDVYRYGQSYGASHQQR